MGRFRCLCTKGMFADASLPRCFWCGHDAHLLLDLAESSAFPGPCEAEAPDLLLPAGPLRAFLAAQVEQMGSQREVAEWIGWTREKLKRILSERERKTVTSVEVDEALTAFAPPLGLDALLAAQPRGAELYPELAACPDLPAVYQDWLLDQAALEEDELLELMGAAT